MTRKLALSIATGLTAFVLVLMAVVATNLFVPRESANAAANATPEPAAEVAGQPAGQTELNSAVQAAVAERDAYYRQQLQAANDRLTEANGRLEQAYAEVDQAKTATPAPAQAEAPKPAQPARSAQTNYAIAPQRAALIALTAAPGASLLSTPAPVSFQGTIAYEVNLDRGTVYVDANTGEVLYNGAAAVISSAPQYQTANDDDDHGERGGHDDDGED